MDTLELELEIISRGREREREEKTLAHTMRYIWNEISEIFL